MTYATNKIYEEKISKNYYFKISIWTPKDLQWEYQSVTIHESEQGRN